MPPGDRDPRAHEDLNDATEPDTAWLPLLNTPPYPSYAGNMAAVGASAARAIELIFGTADIQVSGRWRQSNGSPDAVHTKPLWELAEEQARSRVYGGIHYQFDSDAGQYIAVRVSDYVFAHYMRPRR